MPCQIEIAVLPEFHVYESGGIFGPITELSRILENARALWQPRTKTVTPS